MSEYKYVIDNHPVGKLNGIRCSIDWYAELTYQQFQNDYIPVELEKEIDKGDGTSSKKATIKSINLKFDPVKP